MKVTLDVGGALEFLLLGSVPGGDDAATVIGISTVAYLSAKDPAHVFLPAAVWHDAVYVGGSSAQATMKRSRVDREFLDKCLDIAWSDTLSLTFDQRIDLENEAIFLYRMLRRYGGTAWENGETRDV